MTLHHWLDSAHADKGGNGRNLPIRIIQNITLENVGKKMFFEKDLDFRAERGVTRLLPRFGSSRQLFQIFLSALVFSSGISNGGRVSSDLILDAFFLSFFKHGDECIDALKTARKTTIGI